MASSRVVKLVKIRSLKEIGEDEMRNILERRAEIKKALRKVRKIVEEVKRNGDRALAKYTKKYDGVTIPPSKIKVSEEEVTEAYSKIREEVVNAIRFAAENIRSFHEKQMATFTIEKVPGVKLSQIIRPVECAGIYIPGGRAAYPSTVLMAAIPARVAGVKKCIVCTPPNRDGSVWPEVLVACNEVGVTDVFKVGGAQAIAAMAYGTETIPRADVVVGPGNIYVTAAKVLVSGDVKVDLPAGPSEILVLADESCNPHFVAADLVSQAEHDPAASVILVTTSRRVAEKVMRLVYELAAKMGTRSAAVSVVDKGWCILVEDLDEGVKFVNRYAPEHLEIHVEKPHRILEKIINAGAVFIGSYTPVVLGDYAAGSNHILPTGGYAKSFSGLSVENFIKRISVVECDRRGLEALSESVIVLAEAEGMPAHAQAVRLRLRENES
ncbi:MAG: histidinol dehydrogenase [Candidatus Freyarchaeota archaeon]|nr:histidinol dehydrogenase [Candidatus Jordarchaeia archaeon]